MMRIDLSSKRAKLALRFFTYGVMTVTTVVLTVLAVFYAMGYRFDQSKLTFDQGGLVQFQSTPQNATVIVDGKPENFKTPGRANLTAGTHTVQMQLNGYRSWQKTVDLAPGQLLWLNYVRMIPSDITTTSVKTFDSVTGSMASPDHKWLLLQQKTDQPSFTLANVGNEQKPTFSQITIPDSQLTKVDGHYGQFSIIEWDLSSRYVLIKHQNGPTTEYIRIDRANPTQATNISQLFRLNISEAHFSGTNSDVIYANTDGVLRRLNIPASDASAALVTGLQSFTVYGDDTITFDAQRQPGDATSAQQIIGIYAHDKETVVHTFGTSDQVHFAYGEYFGHNYLAIATADGKVQIWRDPVTSSSKDTTLLTTFDLGASPAWLLFSNSGRMVVAGNGNRFATYDLELAKTYYTTLSLGTNVSQPLRWLDDYYLWTAAGDHLNIFEFDGQNDREITTAVPGQMVDISANGNVLFSIGKNDTTNKFTLQSSNLVTN